MLPQPLEGPELLEVTLAFTGPGTNIIKQDHPILKLKYLSAAKATQIASQSEDSLT